MEEHELRSILKRFADSGWELISVPADAYLCGESVKDELIAAVREGSLSETVLDGAVRRILTLKYRLGLFGEKSLHAYALPADAMEKHRALNRRAQEEAPVLLQNNGALPLSAHQIAVVGPAADDAVAMLGDWTYLSHPDPHPDATHAIPPVTPYRGLCALGERHGNIRNG